jgi:tetratricopeptide (TPR) repeat protein
MDLLEQIGSGAYGDVWLAKNLATGALRAVKVVYRATFAEARPFDREFEGIKSFERISHSHPSQLALFQVGRNEHAGFFYYVMELADPAATASEKYSPRTLRGDLDKGRLPAETVLKLALALTEALAHLHANGLIHRDVKPSNIIFVGGRPKLADIGLVTDASDTRSIVGTEGYLAPEGPGSPAADIFALGKVLYEALTGLDRRQFPELSENIGAWPDRRAAIELNEIVLKACAKDSARRYPSAEAMLADLRLLDAGKSVQRRRLLRRASSSAWKIAAIFALAAGPMWIIRNQPAPKQTTTATENLGTTNVAAWQAVNRAKQMIGTYTARGASNAIAEWERAVQLDPNYAHAWTLLSLGLNIAADRGYILSNEALPRARECAKTAIRLNPKSGGAHRALADTTLALEYDARKAEALYMKALELEPQNHSIKMAWASMLMDYARFDEAARICEEVRAVEPGNGSPLSMLAMISAKTGHVREAFDLYEEALRLEPDRPATYLWRGAIYWQEGQKQTAAGDFLRSVELDGFACLHRERDAAALRTTLEQAGADAMVSRMADLFEERMNGGQFVSALEPARFNALAGRREAAIEWLKKAAKEHRRAVVNELTAMTFREFRGDPDYQAILAELKVPNL